MGGLHGTLAFSNLFLICSALINYVNLPAPPRVPGPHPVTSQGSLAPEPELLPPAPQSTKQGPQYDWEADLRWQEEERAKLKREEEGRVPKLKVRRP